MAQTDYPTNLDPVRDFIGIASTVGMLIWCIVFRKSEKLLTPVGWLMVALGVFAACFLPPA